MSRRLELVLLLEAYRPTSAEKRAHASMSVLARSPADVLSRYHFDPGHFTASAFVLDEPRSSLLLVHHLRLERWLQPGGHVEPTDKHLVEAAEREVTEETGLTDLERVGAVFDLDVHRIPAARGEPSHEHHDVRFLFIGRGDVEAGDGVGESRWVSLDDLPVFADDASVLRVIGKLR